MNRFLSSLAGCGALFACAQGASALTVKPNVGPVVSSAIPTQQLYLETTRVIDLSPFFSDPDASAGAKLTTPLGTMNFTLDGQTAPITVANFLNYVNQGRYFKTDPTNGQLASTFFHRSATNFVIQAGGFLGTVNPNGSNVIQPTQVAPFAAIQNEPFISNTRGTIAMAKVEGNPNSATSQWFINLADNSGGGPALDTQNGGFTVFGRVAGTGMSVADAIAALPKFNFGSPFDAIPLRDYTSPNPVRVPNLVSIPIFTEISPLVFSASSDNPSAVTVGVSGTNLLVNAFQPGSAQIMVTATDLDGVAVAQSFSVNIVAAPGRIRNISTRANFPTGNETLLAGFIVRGGSSKRLVVRAIGPSTGLPSALSNPRVELFNLQGQSLAVNDNWIDSPDKQLLSDLQIAPGADTESALIVTLPSADATITNYTAHVRSANGTPGVGLVEVYDIDSGPGSTLRNISTLGPVGTGADVLIGGFILRGTIDSRRLVVRALGPSLTDRGVSGALPNPKLELFNNQGTLIDSNDDWQTHPGATEIQTVGLAPEDTHESAVILTLPAGEYTAKVIGTGATPTGIGQIEVYQAQ